MAFLSVQNSNDRNENHIYNLFKSPLVHAQGKRPHLSYPTIAVYMPDDPNQ